VILVDTSVWVDHLRATEPGLVSLLEAGRVLGHPWVAGELALGSLAARGEVLGLLHGLPQAAMAREGEVLQLVEIEALYGIGIGIGYVDAQLLAATRLSTGARLWTRDKRLAIAAARLGLAFLPPPASPREHDQAGEC
jgi:predicted nucleic acid-binding protein